MRIELFRLDPASDERSLLKETQTNAGGRTDAPLLAEDELSRGSYELVFEVGAYFAGHPEAGSADPPFFDRGPVRFGGAHPSGPSPLHLPSSPRAYNPHPG